MRTWVAALFEEDCSNYDALPMLGFHFGDYVLNIGPADYIERTADEAVLKVVLTASTWTHLRHFPSAIADPVLRRRRGRNEAGARHCAAEVHTQRCALRL